MSYSPDCHRLARSSPTSTPSTSTTPPSPRPTKTSSSSPDQARSTAAPNASPAPAASTRPTSSPGCAIPRPSISRRNGACRPTARQSRRTPKRPREDQATRRQIASENPASMQPDRPQAPYPGADGVLPFLAGPNGYLETVGHLMHAVQQARIRWPILIPAISPGITEHRPRDRLISDNRPAAVLNVISYGVGTPLDPGQAPQHRRPTHADRVRQVQRVVPPVTHLGPGIVRQRVTHRKAIDRHLDHLAKRARGRPQGHVQMAGNLLSGREIIVKEPAARRPPWPDRHCRRDRATQDRPTRQSPRPPPVCRCLP